MSDLDTMTPEQLQEDILRSQAKQQRANAVTIECNAEVAKRVLETKTTLVTLDNVQYVMEGLLCKITEDYISDMLPEDTEMKTELQKGLRKRIKLTLNSVLHDLME